ncbi:MAG: hypothetical protein M3N68_14465 [Actinomycetota bacterium]|nr:hypothetical protein [Actinomycetota bacterium]
MLVALLSVLVVATAACGDDEPDVVAPPRVDPPGDVARPVAADEPSLVGLEVTVAGNVTEAIAPIAFRIDKDGIGGPGEKPRFDDEDFGDLNFLDKGVLVFDVRETKVDPGAPVQVSGTVREFDLPEAERVFDVELDDRLYGPFRDELVIVADKVTKMPGEAATTTTTRATTTSEAPVGDDLGPQASLVGLEVTADGNVAEVVDPMAFRLDKDGTGEADRPALDDERFGDVELADKPVLVLDVRKTSVKEGGAVRVTGTVRQLDVAEAERLFGVDLDDRLYGPFDKRLVIVADRVATLPAGSAGGSTTTKP